MESLERQIEAGELVPATQVAARTLERLPRQQMNLGVNALVKQFERASEQVKHWRSSAAEFLQSRRENLSASFASRILTPLQQAKTAVATNSAAAAIQAIGSEALHRAAVQDVLQKASVLLRLQGQTLADGSRRFSNAEFRITKVENTVAIVRKSNNSPVVEVSSGQLVHSDLQFKEMASLGMASLDAAQQELSQRASQVRQQNRGSQTRAETALSNGSRSARR